MTIKDVQQRVKEDGINESADAEMNIIHSHISDTYQAVTRNTGMYGYHLCMALLAVFKLADLLDVDLDLVLEKLMGETKK